jgi:hypothetical protein
MGTGLMPALGNGKRLETARFATHVIESSRFLSMTQPMHRGGRFIAQAP